MRDLNACRALPKAERDTLAHASYCRNVCAGDILFLQGDPSLWLFHLRAGSARASVESADGRRQITEFLFPGDVFGFPRDGAYAFTVEMIEAGAVCMFDRRRLEALSGAHPDFAVQLAELESIELDRMHGRLFMLGRQRASERVEAFLRWLAKRQKARTLVLPTSRAEIADYLGLTPETVSRILSGLERDGVVQPIGVRKIEICDPGRLGVEEPLNG